MRSERDKQAREARQKALSDALEQKANRFMGAAAMVFGLVSLLVGLAMWSDRFDAGGADAARTVRIATSRRASSNGFMCWFVFGLPSIGFGVKRLFRPLGAPPLRPSDHDLDPDE